MSDMLMAMKCPECGGSLQKSGGRLFSCVYCGIKYIVLGEEYPISGLTQVIDESNSEDVRGMYLWSPLHVRWDSPQDVRDEAQLMGISLPGQSTGDCSLEELIKRHDFRVIHPGMAAREFEA